MSKRTEVAEGLETFTDGEVTITYKKDPWGRSYPIRARHELPPLLKVVGADGSATSGGTAQWPLPQNGQPGEWLEETEPLDICRVGLHLADRNNLGPWWGRDQQRVFLAEPGSPAIAEMGKYCLSKVRLLEEIPTSMVWAFIAGSTEQGRDWASSEARRAFWEEHRSEAANILRQNLLPNSGLSPTERRIFGTALDGDDRQSLYEAQDSAHKASKFFEARRNYLLVIGKPETPLMQKQRMAADAALPLIKTLAQIMDGGLNRMTLHRHGGPKGKKLVALYDQTMKDFYTAWDAQAATIETDWAALLTRHGIAVPAQQ